MALTDLPLLYLWPLQMKGITVIISGVNHEVKKALLKANIYVMITRYNIHDKINWAIQRAKNMLENETL